MCQSHLIAQKAAHAVAAPVGTVKPAAATQKPATGSRRRRLWELESRAHCPVLGVCLPVAVLRRLVNKLFNGHNVDREYDLHAAAVNQCASRTPLAELMQRELEQCFALALRQAATIKTTGALVTWWAQVSPQDLAGALWATLTHSRCSPELTHQVLGEVHMLQHQTGAAQRTDMKRMEALLDENAVLARELANAQKRHTQLAHESMERHNQQQTELMQLRGSLMIRETQLAHLRDRLRQLEQAVPELACRFKQAGELAIQAERIATLETALALAQQAGQRQQRLAEAHTAALNRYVRHDGHAAQSVPRASDVPDTASPHLEDRAVLCVGGRTASVPLYRHIIERTGGRFIHHDGGDEENLSKLDSTLAAADLVICQTGCISHNAYWRVKDHCKRTGKQCLFVDNTGTASLKRALAKVQPADGA